MELSAHVCGAGTVWYVKGSGTSGSKRGDRLVTQGTLRAARSPTAGLAKADEINTGIERRLDF